MPRAVLHVFNPLSSTAGRYSGFILQMRKVRPTEVYVTCPGGAWNSWVAAIARY